MGTSASDDDGGGNNVGLDTDGPKIVILTKPNSIVKNITADFQLSVSDDRSGVDKVEYQHNTGEWIRINNVLNLVDLAEGLHEVKFKATDKKGNVGNILSYKWTIDKTSPTITLGAVKPAPVSHLAQFNNDMIIKFTTLDAVSAVNLVCFANGTKYECDSGILKIPKSVGYFSARIEATDVAGNLRIVNYSWQVTESAGQLLPPIFKEVPPEFDNRTTVQIHIRGPVGMPDGSTFTCKLDDADVPCEPNKTLTFPDIKERIVDGVLKEHTFVAKIDYVGKGTSEAAISWTTDLRRPVVTVLTKPAAVISNNRATFHFRVTDNSGASNVTLVCLLDADEIECPMNQDIVLNSMTSGDHTLRVNAFDRAGNEIASMIEIKWNSPSCLSNELSLRWPMNGNDMANWGVMSYFDRNAEKGEKRDFGGVNGRAAKVYDNHFSLSLFPGDHKSIYTYNSSGVKTGNASSAAVVAMEAGTVTHVVRDQVDKIVRTEAEILSCRSLHPGYNYVRVKHKNGFISQYNYLSHNSIPAGIVKDATVVRGQILGYAGSSACISQPQLNVSLKNCFNEPIDPLSLGMKHQDATNHEYRATDSGTVSARIMGLLAHNGKFGETAQDLKFLFDRTKLNTSTTAVNTSTSVTLSYFLGHVTHGVTKLQFALVPPGKDGMVNDYLYYPSPHFSGPPLEVNESVGRLMRTQLPAFKKAGTWKVKVYQIRSGDGVCQTRSQREANCKIGAIDVFVK